MSVIEQPLVWALNSNSVRVHVAVVGESRTLCDLAIATTREAIGAGYLFCERCRQASWAMLPRDTRERGGLTPARAGLPSD